jgi:ICP0-binding domain of Ubiquitin-specific protease 7
MAMLYVSKSTFQTKSTSLCFAHCRTKQLGRIHDLESQGLYSNPAQYYDFLQNRVMIVFKPKFEEPNHDHPDFNLTLSKKQNYDIVCCYFLPSNGC